MQMLIIKSIFARHQSGKNLIQFVNNLNNQAPNNN